MMLKMCVSVLFIGVFVRVLTSSEQFLYFSVFLLTICVPFAYVLLPGLPLICSDFFFFCLIFILFLVLLFCFLLYFSDFSLLVYFICLRLKKMC